MEEDSDFALDSFFLNEDYVIKSFVFGEEQEDAEQQLTQSLLCSNSSCTSHDLTGQIIWPAAMLLSFFMYSLRLQLRSSCVLELGSGCGLAGFVAANYCETSIVTDGNEVVMRLLARNQQLIGNANIYAKQLIWDDLQQVIHRPIHCNNH